MEERLKDFFFFSELNFVIFFFEKLVLQKNTGVIEVIADCLPR